MSLPSWSYQDWRVPAYKLFEDKNIGWISSLVKPLVLEHCNQRYGPDGLPLIGPLWQPTMDDLELMLEEEVETWKVCGAACLEDWPEERLEALSLKKKLTFKVYFLQRD